MRFMRSSFFYLDVKERTKENIKATQSKLKNYNLCLNKSKLATKCDLVLKFVDAQTVLLFGRQKFQFFLTLLLLRPEMVLKTKDILTAFSK